MDVVSVQSSKFTGLYHVLTFELSEHPSNAALAMLEVDLASALHLDHPYINCSVVRPYNSRNGAKLNISSTRPLDDREWKEVGEVICRESEISFAKQR